MINDYDQTDRRQLRRRRSDRDFLVMLACMFLLTFVLGASVGYLVAMREAAHFVQCDGDMDCLEKNGCGGYADPCEVTQ